MKKNQYKLTEFFFSVLTEIFFSVLMDISKNQWRSTGGQSRELELMTRKKLKPAIWIMNEHKRAKS